MSIFESKQHLDYADLIKDAVKSKKKSALKRFKKLMPSKKVLRKKSKKWLMKRDYKVDRVLADFDFVNSFYGQIRVEYDQLKTDFLNEIIEAAHIPARYFDNVSMKTNRFNNQVSIYCQRGADTPVEFIYDYYVVDLDAGLVYAYDANQDH